MLVIDWRIFVDFLFFRYFRLTSLLIKISPILFPFLFHPTFFFSFIPTNWHLLLIDMLSPLSMRTLSNICKPIPTHWYNYIYISTHTHIVGMLPSAQHIEACLQCQQLLHESNSHLLYIEATQSSVSMLIALKV